MYEDRTKKNLTRLILCIIIHYITFLFVIFLMATRSPFKIPIVVNTWVGGRLPQLAIDARPELIPNCWVEKFCENIGDMGNVFLFPMIFYDDRKFYEKAEWDFQLSCIIQKRGVFPIKALIMEVITVSLNPNTYLQ